MSNAPFEFILLILLKSILIPVIQAKSKKAAGWIIA